MLQAWKRAGYGPDSAVPVEAATRISCRDALDLPLPKLPTLLFLFNPFGAPVLRRLLKRIGEEFSGRAGQLDLVYVNNEQEGELECHRGFRRLFIGQVARSRGDAIADHTILAHQPDGEYAAANYEDCSIWRWTG